MATMKWTRAAAQDFQELQCGYGEYQEVTRYMIKLAHSSGVYGWNYSVYLLPDALQRKLFELEGNKYFPGSSRPYVIVTGYRGMHGERPTPEQDRLIREHDYGEML